jgi:hypothetical protein
MLIKELINKSVYGTIGYISSQEDIDTLEQYLIYNLPVLKEFKHIIVATNYKEFDLNLINRHIDMWERYFPNVRLIDNEVNRGHNHGYADLDNLIFDFCKKSNIDWLCKSANDTILMDILFEKEIPEVDFYYLNGVGYGGMVKYNFDFVRILNEDFYPQTNLYFINVSKCDYLNNQEYLDKTYNHLQTLENYNGKIWEHLPGWSCEDFLKNCIQRNNLSKFHLISEEKYLYLLKIIKDDVIHDCSHKNLLIEGICHMHYKEQLMTII